MLESIISPGTAERSPWDMIVLGFVIASVALWMGYYLADYIHAPPSILVLVVTVMALAPLMHRVLVMEEEEEELAGHDSMFGFVIRHLDVIFMYCFLFLGLLAAFSFWYVVLPYQAEGMPSGGEVFGLQNQTISSLQRQVTGDATGMAAADDAALARQRGFVRLYSNNMNVMLFCFLASFMFGAGALWIMAWNASVIGVFVGNKIKASLMGISPLEGYLTGFPFYSMSIALWAVPEIMAYMVAGIAGGIVSVAVTRHHLRSEGFWLTLFDAFLFMLIAIFLVFLGAYIEHFFLPV